MSASQRVDPLQIQKKQCKIKTPQSVKVFKHILRCFSLHLFATLQVWCCQWCYMRFELIAILQYYFVKTWRTITRASSSFALLGLPCLPCPVWYCSMILAKARGQSVKVWEAACGSKLDGPGTFLDLLKANIFFQTTYRFHTWRTYWQNFAAQQLLRHFLCARVKRKEL